MTIREMEIFLAVIEHKTMRKAGEKLFISQPTISGVIKNMEADMGVLLFERLGKKLFLTSAGEQLKEYAEKTLTLHREIKNIINTNSLTVRLHIGATVSIGGRLLGNILGKWPYIQPFVQVTNTHDIEEKLLCGELDCAIVEGSVHHPDLVRLPLFRDQMYLFCCSNHEKFTGDGVSIEDIEEEMFILREEGSGTREATLDFFRANNLHPTILWQSNSMEAIFNAVKMGIGVVIASEKLNPMQEGIKMLRIEGAELNRVFHFIYHKDKYQSTGFTAFLQLCQAEGDIEEITLP